MVVPPVPGSIRFENIANVRDVGLFTNAISGVRRMKPGRLFRAARPDFASTIDIDTLRSTLQIQTIIDLRSKTERLQIAARADHDTPAPPSPSPAPLPITTLHLPLHGPLFQLHLILLLPWLSILRLLLLYLTGHRIPAIRVLAAAMAPRGLTGLATDCLLSSHREMRRVFGVLARPDAWPVVLHCTQGKDRTGLLVLLLEMLCGVDRQTCARDYMASQAELAASRQRLRGEIAEVGLPEAWADCEAGWVDRVWRFVEVRWGGAEGYLTWCGVGREEIGLVRAHLGGE